MTIFSNRVAAIADMRRDRLTLAAASVLPAVALSDDYVYLKLLAAEAEIARRLRVCLEPTVVVPWDAPQDELDALDAAGKPWKQEAAYDYSKDFFQGESFGFIVANNKPIISVESLRLVYPTSMNQVFQIPPEWIRMDRRAGQIRLIPNNMAFAAPLGAFLLQALGGGRVIPFMIQLRYTVGLKNVLSEWPDLVAVIKKQAVLDIIADAFLPQSGSISADGLSQSLSVDMDKYGEYIDAKIDGPKGANGGLMTAIHGVRLMVC